MKTTKKDTIIVSSTDYRYWDSSYCRYSVLIKGFERKDGIWFRFTRSHELDPKLGWVGNHQRHEYEIALDGLLQAVQVRKNDLIRARQNRQYKIKEQIAQSRFQAEEKQVLEKGFIRREPRKARNCLTWRLADGRFIRADKYRPKFIVCNCGEKSGMEFDSILEAAECLVTDGLGH